MQTRPFEPLPLVCPDLLQLPHSTAFTGSAVVVFEFGLGVETVVTLCGSHTNRPEIRLHEYLIPETTFMLFIFVQLEAEALVGIAWEIVIPANIETITATELTRVLSCIEPLGHCPALGS
jgi:hypothetical protein